ncbi:MAG: hypothetical protein BWK80_25750 [Desulfobacteraceae bacterium IS3]|nr:MAG: hypothetical protein BWK80_25750 [Desulfobacteraceae bacterium IS3]
MRHYCPRQDRCFFLLLYFVIRGKGVRVGVKKISPLPGHSPQDRYTHFQNKINKNNRNSTRPVFITGTEVFL